MVDGGLSGQRDLEIAVCAARQPTTTLTTGATNRKYGFCVSFQLKMVFLEAEWTVQEIMNLYV